MLLKEREGETQRNKEREREQGVELSVSEGVYFVKKLLCEHMLCVFSELETHSTELYWFY